MQSLLTRTKNFLTPTGSSANLHESGKFRTEKQAESLFQQTDPKIDGEDCLHDCASCTEQLPRKWSIDEEDQLYGHVKGWETHLIVGTGKTDWVRDVTEEQGSLMQAVGELGLDLSNGKLMLSASDMPYSSDSGNAHDAWGSSDGQKGGDYVNEGRTKCIVLPRWEVVTNVGVKEAKWLLDDIISKGSTNSTPISKPSARNSISLQKGETVVQKEPEERPSTPDVAGLSIQHSQPRPQQQSPNPDSNGLLAPPSHNSQIPTPILKHLNPPPSIRITPLHHRAIILMCSHSTRDWRCGKSAPILKREFERHLRPLGLYREFDDERPGGVGIYFINHVGGHKYSANVMIYRREGRKRDGMDEGEVSGEAVQGIWLARVRPEDCENIVRYTVLQGKLVKPQRQLRGGFDRERGVLSW
ncbi:hypothetical protein LTS08_004305 [Lithohypha guttulata]|uniref:Uncharacterized protein n=1 Tax=Lithohypha guttulata TaxID=1690604 RepID=A0AAN7T050_9EURO|nr:hypothetical protein LTR51_005863 [Lithohypha guttulata]KAK5086381.1 hypothetical protein LTR05_003549 [Lithohypha guttulata]KAK5101846.1 hypothetical protein LTS08_004305 [Lithohypha guttulata]